MDLGVTVERLGAQLLTRREARTPEDVVERLLAVQAQDPRGARLAIRSRSTGLLAADVDHALSVDRSLAIGWLNRGTLHLVPARDYWWLHALTTPQTLSASTRRLVQEGVDAAEAERGMTALRRALDTHGALTRTEIRDHLASADVPTAGQAVVHLLGLACSRGIAVRGPVVSSGTGFEQAFVPAHDWLGAPPPVDRDVALARLAQGYLAGHGPAADRDLARWAGISLGAARTGLRAIGGSLTERGDGLVALAGRGDEDNGALPRPCLLGAFDPVLLGWRSRDGILGPHEAAIVDGGVFRAFALVRGRAVGRWQITAHGVRIMLLEEVDPADATALDADAADVERFLDLGGHGRDRIVPTP